MTQCSKTLKITFGFSTSVWMSWKEIADLALRFGWVFRHFSSCIRSEKVLIDAMKTFMEISRGRPYISGQYLICKVVQPVFSGPGNTGSDSQSTLKNAPFSAFGVNFRNVFLLRIRLNINALTGSLNLNLNLKSCLQWAHVCKMLLGRGFKRPVVSLCG